MHNAHVTHRFLSTQESTVKEPRDCDIRSQMFLHRYSQVDPGMGSRQFYRGRGRDRGREVEAEATSPLLPFDFEPPAIV